MEQYNTPKYLEEAFGKDFAFTDEMGNRYNLYSKEVGSLNAIDGKIITCDPFLFNNDIPFHTQFPIGQFPVELAIAKNDDDERVALSRIKFSDSKPIKWVMAVCDEKDLAKLEPGDIYGYGVDSGTGCFMDTSGGKEFYKYLTEDPDNSMNLITEMEKTYKHTRSWLLWKRNNCTVAMFSTGWGDGYYVTYIGLDVDNNICRLVTDFELIEASN